MKEIIRFSAALAAVIVAKGTVVADAKRRRRQKRVKHYQKVYPEKSPEFLPHPDCAAAVAKREAVWARWLAQQCLVGQKSRCKINFRLVKQLY